MFKLVSASLAPFAKFNARCLPVKKIELVNYGQFVQVSGFLYAPDSSSELVYKGLNKNSEALKSMSRWHLVPCSLVVAHAELLINGLFNSTAELDNFLIEIMTVK